MRSYEGDGVPLNFDSAPTAATAAGAPLGLREELEPQAALPRKWPEPLTEAAFYGVAGEYVRLVEPASEADTAALLLQFLVAAGNVIGHKPYYLAEDTPHHVNFYTVLVGLSSKSRKGTSWGRVKRLFTAIDEEWATQCLSSGLSSGEGLIEAVRDPSRDGGEDDEGDKRVGDRGVTDKRLLISQGEFCSVLQSMERSGNTLSMVLRDAWDGENLRTMTRKNNALRATGAHISMIGHITRDELRSALTETDKANGFANRILWACVARSKELPDGAEIDRTRWSEVTSRVKAAVGFAAKVERIQRSEDAKEIWRKVYHELSEGQPGMFGAVTSRGEAQVVRLSCLYALLNGAATVEAEHLQAGLGIWRYCEDSARYIFGNQLGDSVADAILAHIRESQGGLTRNEIRELFGRNKSSARIEQVLTLLQEHGKITMRKEQTDGRPREVWSAAGGTP